jgi:hypothetical protein
MNDRPPTRPPQRYRVHRGRCSVSEVTQEKRKSCPRIDANLREKEIGSWFSLAFADKNNCLFFIGGGMGIESAEWVVGSRKWDVGR